MIAYLGVTLSVFLLTALLEYKLIPILRSHKVGDVVTVVVKRGSEKVTLSVTLVEYIPESISLSD